jgi:hypothetical protein
VKKFVQWTSLGLAGVSVAGVVLAIVLMAMGRA